MGQNCCILAQIYALYIHIYAWRERGQPANYSGGSWVHLRGERERFICPFLTQPRERGEGCHFGEIISYIEREREEEKAVRREEEEGVSAKEGRKTNSAKGEGRAFSAKGEEEKKEERRRREEGRKEKKKRRKKGGEEKAILKEKEKLEG